MSVLATGGADSISCARLYWTRSDLAEAAKDSLRGDGHCADDGSQKGKGRQDFEGGDNGSRISALATARYSRMGVEP